MAEKDDVVNKKGIEALANPQDNGKASTPDFLEISRQVERLIGMMGNKFAALPPYQQMQVRSALSEQLFLQPNNPELAIDAANHKVELILQANAIADQAQKEEELKKAKLTEFREDRDVLEIEKQQELATLRKESQAIELRTEIRAQEIQILTNNINNKLKQDIPGLPDDFSFENAERDELRELFKKVFESLSEAETRRKGQEYIHDFSELQAKHQEQLNDSNRKLHLMVRENRIEDGVKGENYSEQRKEYQEKLRHDPHNTYWQTKINNLDKEKAHLDHNQKMVQKCTQAKEDIGLARDQRLEELQVKQEEHVAEQKELVTAEVAKEGKDQTILENCEIMKELCGVDKDVESLQQFFPHLRNAVKGNPALLEDELVKTTYDSLKKEYTEGKAKNLAFPLANNTNAQPPLHQAQGWRSILDNSSPSPEKGGNGRGR